MEELEKIKAKYDSVSANKVLHDVEKIWPMRIVTGTDLEPFCGNCGATLPKNHRLLKNNEKYKRIRAVS